jgi:hypothetical protein
MNNKDTVINKGKTATSLDFMANEISSDGGRVLLLKRLGENTPQFVIFVGFLMTNAMHHL